MIVVDASALVDALTGVEVVTDRLADERLTAPAVIDAEAGSALRRLWMIGELGPALADSVIAALPAVDVLRFEHRSLIPRAWELRHNLSFTDALYVALAEQLGIPLVTLDARLAGAPGIRADVEVLRRA